MNTWFMPSMCAFASDRRAAPGLPPKFATSMSIVERSASSAHASTIWSFFDLVGASPWFIRRNTATGRPVRMVI